MFEKGLQKPHRKDLSEDIHLILLVYHCWVETLSVTVQVESRADSPGLLSVQTFGNHLIQTLHSHFLQFLNRILNRILVK